MAKNFQWCHCPARLLNSFQTLVVLFLAFALANRSRSSAKNICEKPDPSFDALTLSHIAILFPLTFFLYQTSKELHAQNERQRLVLNGKKASNLPPLNRREVEMWKSLLYNSKLAQWSWDKSLHWWKLFSQNSIPSDVVLSPNQF